MYRQGQNGVSATQLDVYSPLGVKQSFELTTEPSNGRDQSTILIGAGGVPADFTFAGLGAALQPVRRRGLLRRGHAARLRRLGNAHRSLAPVPRRGPARPGDPRRPLARRGRTRAGARTRWTPPTTRNSSAADLSLGAPTPRPNSATPTEFECVPCGGVTATIVGTDEKETLRGTAGPDVIAAKAGADTVIGPGRRRHPLRRDRQGRPEGRHGARPPDRRAGARPLPGEEGRHGRARARSPDEAPLTLRLASCPEQSILPRPGKLD